MNKTLQNDSSLVHNSSFASLNTTNKSLLERSKMDAMVMREKRQNVVKSQQNMAQLKNRIEALKRNVEQAQKKAQQDER